MMPKIEDLFQGVKTVKVERVWSKDGHFWLRLHLESPGGSVLSAQVDIPEEVLGGLDINWFDPDSSMKIDNLIAP